LQFLTFRVFFLYIWKCQLINQPIESIIDFSGAAAGKQSLCSDGCGVML